MPHHTVVDRVTGHGWSLPAAMGDRTSVSAFGLVASVVVTIGVVVLILLFEKRRAKQIEHDLRAPRSSRPRRPGEPGEPGERRDDGGTRRE